MKNIVEQVLVCVLICLSTAIARNMQSTTPRTQITPIGLTTKKPHSYVKNITEIMTDVRTPPKVKQMIKKSEHKSEHSAAEYSHPGIAEPVDDDIDVLEETMKKLSFYKLDRPTTDSGLSTWILLSGQSSSTTTTKPPTSPTSKDKNNAMDNVSSIISNPDRINKPLFKKRPLTTTTTRTTTTQKTTSPKSTTQKTTSLKPTFTTLALVVPVSTISPEKNTKLSKIKPLVLNNTSSNINSSLITLSSFKSNTSTTIKKDDTKIVKVSAPPNKTAAVKVVPTTELVPESKEGDLELHSSTTATANPKKPKRPTNKKKKDKNRRKRPSADAKNEPQNKTKIANKVSQKEKPFTTQIYNYLAREVMPTVGVGLVGLVVTAGLASYFLYPFGSLRRSYEVDRHDKDYISYYGGAIAEEEAIGKVIAGMPMSSDSYSSNYRQPNYQNSYVNNRYRQVENTYYPNVNKGTSDPGHVNPVNDYIKNDEYIHDTRYSNDISKNEPITYNKDVMSQNVETSYATGDQQFVVGSVPKEIIEEITPAAVPEHGPRSLKVRKRRNSEDEISNEIDFDDPPAKFDQSIHENEQEENHLMYDNNTKVNTTNSIDLKQALYDFVKFLRDLFTAQVKIGLEMLRDHARSLSQYLRSVRTKLDELKFNNIKNN